MIHYGDFADLFVRYYYRSEQLKTDTAAFDAVEAQLLTYQGEPDILHMQRVLDSQKYYDLEKDKLDDQADAIESLNNTIIAELEVFRIKPHTKLHLKMEYHKLHFWYDDDGFVQYEEVKRGRGS